MGNNNDERKIIKIRVRDVVAKYKWMKRAFNQIYTVSQRRC